MQVHLINDPSLADAITHGGNFHADEIMATVILSKLFPGLTVCRVNALPEQYNKDAVIYDIGGGIFDHHQRGGNGERANGVPYAAAGLIWKEFGKKLTSAAVDPEAAWRMMDEELIQGFDAIDNGVLPARDYPTDCKNVPEMIGLFNRNWDEEGAVDDSFLEAAAFAETVYDKVYSNILSRLRAADTVEKSIENAEDHIMVLERFVPWQEWIFRSSNKKADAIHYVIYPTVRGGYNCQCVPDVYGGFGQRKPMPESWRGLKGEELQKETGVASAVFCHAAGFIGGAETLEGAYKLAEKAEKAE